MTQKEIEMLRLLDGIKNEKVCRDHNEKEIELLTTCNGESYIRENELRAKLVQQSKEYSRVVWD